MSLTRIDPDDLYPDAPYHYATVAGPGTLVFVAGACPIDANGQVVDPDLIGQTTRAVDNLLIALTAAGVGFDDVLKTTIYVVSSTRSELVTAWKVVEAAFGDVRPPSTLLGVSMLGYPGQLVEIEAIAIRRD